VGRVEDAAGRVVKEWKPLVVRKVLEPETVDTLTELLKEVVRSGTGKHAAIPGYVVAGKTGTAQKLDPATRAYSRKPGVLSFVGFVPANAPRVAIVALLDEPKTAVWGSEAAAPIFAAVASQVLRHLDIPAGGTPSVQIVRGSAAELMPVAAGSAPAGSDGPEAVGRPGERPRRPQPEGLATRWTTPRDQMENRDPQEAVMPDLVGRSLRQALDLLAGHDVDVSVSGRGIIVRQTPPAGAALPPGASCRIELAPPALAPLP